ncbi:MAG: hypothetical protein ACTSRP_03375 [Candidatus Helarchaeota archaeon]
MGDKALIIITDQPDYETFVESIKVINKEITLIFLKDTQFYLFSNFKDEDFINSILSKLEEHNFTLISKEILPSETSEEAKIKDEPIVKQVEREEAVEISGDELDLFENLFNTDLKDFPCGLGTEDPLVLILSKTEGDDYSATIQIMCRELYRELIRGLPLPKRITEERLEENADVSDRIIFIDDDKAKELGLGKISTIRDVNWINLGKKLQEFFSRNFGFYIFEIPSDKMEEFKIKLEKYTKNLRPRIVQVFPRLLGKRLYLELTEEGSFNEFSDLVELKKKICSLMWGFVTPEHDDRWKQGNTFDNFFTSCEKEYNDRLRNLEIQKIKVEGNKISVSNLVKSVKSESDIHFRIKVFIVKYLYEIEKYSKNSVKIEQELDESRIIPDIWVGNTVFEVETLYNSERPLNKIAEKVKNYKNKGKKVIIVLKNLDVFLYYKYLINLERELKEEEYIDVEFKTLNFKNSELVHIKEIGKFFHSLFE